MGKSGQYLNCVTWLLFEDSNRRPCTKISNHPRKLQCDKYYMLYN